MKSRIASRYLLTAVMALMLCAVLAVSSFAAIGLKEDGTLAGLQSAKTYTANSYDIIAGTTGTENITVTKTTELAAGIWAVSDGTATEYVFVPGTDTGKINFASDVVGTQGTITAGKWSKFGTAITSAFKYHAATPGFEITLVPSAVNAEDVILPDAAVGYGFTKEQVIPAYAFTKLEIPALNLPTTYAAGYTAADASLKVEFILATPGSTSTTSEYAIVTGHETGALTINAPAALANSNAYIIGIKIFPWGGNTADILTLSGRQVKFYMQLKASNNAADYTLKYSSDIEVTSVTLDKQTANLLVNDSVVLTATVNPDNATDKSIIWTTTDAEVATVNNGTVIAVGAGEATITATAGAKSGSCVVTVTDEPQLPNHEGLSVTLSGMVEGLEAGKNYTIQSYDVLTGAKGVKSVLTASTVVDAGVWYVSNGEKGGYVFVAGGKSGEINYWDASNNKPLAVANTTSTAPVAGKWTRGTDGAFTFITTYCNADATDHSICIHFSKDKFLKKADGVTNYAGSTPIIGADNKLQENIIYYGFTAEQVVPASMVKDLTASNINMKTGACSYNTGKTSADHKGIFTFYVKDPVTGNTTTYTVDTVGEQKVFAAPAAMAEDAGYVIGFSFAPFANSDDDLLVCAPTDVGASTGYAHFTLKAGVNKLTLNDSAFPAPEGITIENKKVTGLKAGSHYQYAPVTLGYNAALEVGTPVVLDANAAPEGLFVVRETNAAGTAYTAWTDMMYIEGSSLGNILHTTKITGAEGAHKDKVIDVPVTKSLGSVSEANIAIDQFVPGTWTGFQIGYDLQKYYGFTPLVIGSTSCYIYAEAANYLDTTDATVRAEKQALAQKLSNGIYFAYAYEPDEIIAMENWDSFKFTIKKRQGGLSLTSGALKTRVTLYVVTEDGQVEKREALYDIPYGDKTITTKQADFADNSGYIVGIKINPYVALDGAVLTPTAKVATDYNLLLLENAYKLVLTKEPAPTGLYLEDGVIKGFDASKTYSWAYQYIDSQSTSTVITGVTELSGVTGLIAVMTAGDNVLTGDSEPVLFYVPGSANDRATIGQVPAGTPAYKTSSEWIAGTWTGSYLSWHDQTAGAYAFLDQTAGVGADDSQKLWLYQVTKEQAQAKLDADAAKSAAEGVPTSWTNANVKSNPARLQAVIDAHYAAPDYAETLEANKAAHQAKIARAFETRYIQYAYDETEIIPASELVEMSFTSKSRQTDFTFTATAKVIFYVMDADGFVMEYTANGLAEEYTPGTWKKTTVNVQSIENWPEEGWVVGVRYYPLGAVDETTVRFSNTSFRSDASIIAYSFTQHHICMGYYYTPFKDYVILAPATAPTFEVKANAAGAGYDVVITNYNSSANYQYKAVDGNWTDITGNTFTVAETGVYTVKVSGELLIGTAQADCIVEKFQPTAATLKYGINSAEDFKVTITNPSQLYSYEYKAEADTEWTAVEGTSFVVAAVGKYEVRAFGEIWDGYAVAEITVELAAPETPKVSVVPNDTADFTVTIKNFSDLYAYEYQLEGESEWTPVTEKSFVIAVGGQHTLRAGGTVYDGFATATFRAVPVDQEIKALSIVDGVLKGLDAAKAYEYAKVNYLGISNTWNAIPAGTEYTFAEPGLYAVRLVGSDAAPMVFNKLGSIADRGTIINTEAKAYPSGTYWDKGLRQLDVLKWTKYDDKMNPEFSVGRWSGWNVGDLAYWSKDWVTAIGSTNYVDYAYLGALLTAGTMSQAEVRDLVSTYVFKYAYEDAEIIPLTDLELFNVRTGLRQGHLVTQGDVYSKFVFYIANDYGEIETRELVLKADHTSTYSKTTHTIKASDFEETSGYIVAIDVYPFGVIPETTTFNVSGTIGHDYEAKFLDYKVKLPRIDAPTTLVFNEETKLVEGLDETVEYYYAPYSINGVGEKLYVSGETTLELTAGLWGVGIVSYDPEFADSLPFIVLVKGDEAGRKDLGERTPSGYFVASSGTNEFVPGSWTGNGADTHSSFGTNGLSTLGGHVIGILAGNLSEAIAAGDPAAEAAARQAIVTAADNVLFRYAYTNEEIIPSSELLNFQMDLQKRMGSLNLGAGIIAKVTFYVVMPDGSIETFTWEEGTSTTSKTSHNIDVQSIEGWPMNGYVVAVDINPWTNVNPENVVVLDANKYNTMAQFNLTGYVIKLQPTAPALETFTAPKGGFGEISNLFSAMEYEYKIWDEAEGAFVGDWMALTTSDDGDSALVRRENGTAAKAKPGKYLIRVAESRNFTVSEAVEITVSESDAAVVSLQNETKKIWLPNDFVEVSADYEIDVTTKVWVSRLALDNMKAVAPESTLTIAGDGFKYVVTAADLDTSKAVHYYNFALSFDGDSRYDTTYDDIVDLAGDAYIVEFFTESIDKLPFEAAELYIKVDSEYDGQDVELRTYNERIGKLRKTETATVDGGWVMFTNFGGTFVVVSTEE